MFRSLIRLQAGNRKYFLFAIAWGLLALSDIVVDKYGGSMILLAERLIHVLSYMVMGFLLVRMMFPGGMLSWRRVIAICGLMIIFTMIDDSTRKAIMPGAHHNGLDDFINALAGSLAAVMLRTHNLMLNSRKRDLYMRMLLHVQGDLSKLMASNIFNNSVTFFTGFIVATMTGPRRFGVYTATVSVIMTLLAISDLGVGSAMVRRFAIFKDENLRRKVLQAAAGLRVTMSVTLLVLSVPLGLIISKFISFEGYSMTLELVAACLCAAVLGLWSYLRAVWQAKQDYERYGSLTIRYGVARMLGVILIFMANAPVALYYILALYLFAPATVIWTSIAELRGWTAIFRERALQTEIRMLVTYGKWVLISALTYPLCLSLPVFILMRVQGPAQAGLFSVGLLFAGILGPLSDAIRTFLLPKVSAFSNHAAARDYIRMIFRLSIPFLLSYLVLMVSVGVVFELVFSARYGGGLLEVEILVAAVGFALFWGVLNSLIHYLNIPSLDAIVNLVRLAAVALLGSWLIPRYSVMGAVLSASVPLVVGEIVMFVIMLRYMNKRQLPMPFSAVADNTFRSDGKTD